LDGGEEAHPGALAAGVDADSVTRYPVTATLSLALKERIATVRVWAEAGSEKDMTVGAVVSIPGKRVMVVEALTPEETFPAASLAQAYSVLEPAEEKV
jgi:predicted dinucleotide-utilizing enzyme